MLTELPWLHLAGLLTRDKRCHWVRCSPAGPAVRRPTSTWGADRFLHSSCCRPRLQSVWPPHRGASAIPSATRTWNTLPRQPPASSSTLALPSHYRHPCSISAQPVWDLWWRVWQWGRVFSQYFGFALSAPCHQWHYTFIHQHCYMTLQMRASLNNTLQMFVGSSSCVSVFRVRTLICRCQCFC
jgi:hypothetical protein